MSSLYRSYGAVLASLFLGIVAAGMMLVILLGHIDLSVPWTIAASAMMGTAVASGPAVVGRASRKCGQRDGAATQTGEEPTP